MCLPSRAGIVYSPMIMLLTSKHVSREFSPCPCLSRHEFTCQPLRKRIRIKRKHTRFKKQSAAASAALTGGSVFSNGLQLPSSRHEPNRQSVPNKLQVVRVSLCTLLPTRCPRRARTSLQGVTRNQLRSKNLWALWCCYRDRSAVP